MLQRQLTDTVVKAESWFVHVPAHLTGVEHRGMMLESLEVAWITPMFYVVTHNWRLGVGWESKSLAG